LSARVRVAVIGGGVVGCSVLYHLAKLGWKDILLVERKELTAGSSWHAAGGFHAINGDPNVARLQAYTIRLYEEIQALSGQDIGMHRTGGLNVAATPERWELLRAEWARHRVLGLDSELVGPAEIARLCPLMSTEGVIGAIHDPNEGHVDPSGVTHAYAKAAQKLGASIRRQTLVTHIEPTGRGTWRLVMDTGDIEAEHVVNAAGLWAREVGRMAGAELPLVPLEHHYLVTGDIPELATLAREIPVTADLDGGMYLRQERQGVLLGVYEENAKLWSADTTPWDYGETDLLPPDLDRISEALARGFARFPAVERAGIRRVVNGPFTFTPDGNPLVGAVPGLPNYWVACGVMAGFAQGGGVGLALAQWMVHGEPESDIFAMDVARFGPHAGVAYTHAKAREFYAHRFQIAYPNEFWPATRPLRTSPVYEDMRAARAVFGVSYGLEVPMYFARPGDEVEERPCIGRSNAFHAVAEECLAVRTNVGILETASFAKYAIEGPAAADWLDVLLAGRLPPVGRIRLMPMLSPAGRLMGDFTLMRPAEERFLLFGSGYLQSWHLRWFMERLPASGVVLRNLSDDRAGFAIAGPRSRELLARVTGTDVGPAALPFLAVRELEFEGVPALVCRMSVTGELGYEVYVPASSLRVLAKGIAGATADLGARNFGIYALNSLRLEKSYGIWSREFTRDYTPRMSGLDRFVDYGKPRFVGRDAALRDRDERPPHRLVTLAIDADGADAWGFEPVWRGDETVGFTTSGGYGHSTGMSLAMGYVRTELANGDEPLEVSIVGERRPARILPGPAIDPDGARMRA